MSARRGESGLSGILLVDKPEGLSSHDVVNRVRRVAGEKRVGHAGTLDPMATGLLVVLVGPAARLASYLTAAQKHYQARIVFGTETDTDDAEGRVVSQASLQSRMGDVDFARATVAALVGTHEQVPPAYSAIKRDGVTAYHAARKGEAIELEPRTVHIDSAELLAVDAAGGSWDIDLAVSKGTYIRAIARDLGRSLRSAAHLGALRRTRSGGLDVADAVPLADIVALPTAAALAELFVDPASAVGLPVIQADRTIAAAVADGRRFELAGARSAEAIDAAGPVADGLVHDGPVAIVHESALLAVYAVKDGLAIPEAVIPGGVRKGRG